MGLILWNLCRSTAEMVGVMCVWGKNMTSSHKLLIKLFIVTVEIMGFDLAFSISVNSSSSFVPSAPPTFSLTFCKTSKWKKKKTWWVDFFFFSINLTKCWCIGEVKTRNSPNSKQSVDFHSAHEQKISLELERHETHLSSSVLWVWLAVKIKILCDEIIKNRSDAKANHLYSKR